ncbi:hypothetical protein DPMN_023009 [Dreissena polymorpha]|uniref:Uncharacterized protein n=1 Tax=Dreissena polymorpha TaxID=45954 RepID=A0A9D4LM26_DREPO|nr:hypothetical protein DPMN_023009 [Dreissena polymorpha]
MYFLYGSDSGSPCLCSKEEYLLHDGIAKPTLGDDADCTGSPDVIQLMKVCSFFTDPGSDVCVRSFVVIQNAAEILVGEAIHLLHRLALDCDGCVVNSAKDGPKPALKKEEGWA